jgi:hypothetical protein
MVTRHVAEVAYASMGSVFAAHPVVGCRIQTVSGAGPTAVVVVPPVPGGAVQQTNKMVPPVIAVASVSQTTV